MKKFTSFVTGLLFTAMLTVGSTAVYAQEAFTHKRGGLKALQATESHSRRRQAHTVRAARCAWTML